MFHSVVWCAKVVWLSVVLHVHNMSCNVMGVGASCEREQWKEIPLDLPPPLPNIYTLDRELL